MPLIILAGIIIQFPLTSISLLLAITVLMTWSTRKKSEIQRLEHQRYQDDVAGFGWREDIDPVEFEERCAEAMRLAGWSAHTTKGSGDQGVDVLAELNQVRVVLQCKRYAANVGNKAVQEAFAAKCFVQANYAAVVTNSKFTPSARALAAATGVLLLHFTDLARPNTLFGLLDTQTPYRASGVTDTEIETLRKNRMKPVYPIGFCLAIALSLLHDLGQVGTMSSPAPTLTQAKPNTASNPISRGEPSQAPSGGQNSQSQPTAQRSPRIAPPQSTKSDSKGGQTSSQNKLPLKTRAPTFLRDSNTFCTVESEFDNRWRWMLSGNHAHEPATPSCTFVFGQIHPLRVSVLRRARENKMMIRVEEGYLAGQVGYTDAYSP